MACYIQRPDGSALYFDICEEERHGGVAQVTKFPVEDGPDVNDHVRPEPTPFTMRCVISNTPLVAPPETGIFGLAGNNAGGIGNVTVDISPYVPPFSLGASVVSALVNPVGAITNAIQGDPGKKSLSQPVLMFPQDFNAPMDAFFILQDMQDKQELLIVFTSIADYHNVVLERFELIRNAGTGTGAEVELTFVTLNIVHTETTATPITTEPVAKTVKKAGKKDPEPAPQLKSDAAHIKDGVTNWLNSP